MLIAVPEQNNGSTLTDWVESSLLFSREKSLSKAQISDALKSAMKRNVENLISNIWLEATARKTIALTSYPFDVNTNYIERQSTWRTVIPYSFLTLVSGQDFITDLITENGDRKHVAKMFEKLTASALEAYIGKSIIIGSPREDPAPSSFADCLEYICREIGERPRKDPEITPKAQDDKVDIIAWNTIDNRAGKVIVLANCATGKNWQGKERELRIRDWNDYIQWPFSPFRAFAYPYVRISGWYTLSRGGGLLFDRLRISKFAKIKKEEPLRNELISWIKEKKDKIPWM